MHVIEKIQSKRRGKMQSILRKAWSTRRRESGEKFADFKYWDKMFLKFLERSGWDGFETRHYSKTEKFKIRYMLKAYGKMQSGGAFRPDFGINEWMSNENPFENEMNWICLEGHKFRSKMKTHYREHLRCPVCDPYLNVGTSKAEREMQEFLNAIWPHPKTDRNRRDVIPPLELDDYISDKMTAFEFDGLYAHCDINKKDGYHQMKTKMCRAKGIRLIHVFEDEWRDRRAVCESYIKAALGLNEKTNVASLTVGRISQSEFNSFTSANCIENPAACDAAYGLYAGSTLAFSIGYKHTWANKYKIICPCCKLGLKVAGAIDAANKIFIEEFQPSYISLDIDRRWFDESSMNDMTTMKLSGRKRSSFYYVNYGYSARYRPDEITDDVLRGLKQYDPNATTEKNISLCKFSKIWDCGAFVYTWKKRR